MQNSNIIGGSNLQSSIIDNTNAGNSQNNEIEAVNMEIEQFKRKILESETIREKLKRQSLNAPLNASLSQDKGRGNKIKFFFFNFLIFLIF